MIVSDFVKVGVVADFPLDRGRRVKVRRDDVAVFRRGRRWFAIQDSCPHMGASLADGKPDGDCVVCHWHEWKFDLNSGQGDQRSWARARLYEVKVEGNDVLVRPHPDAEKEPRGDKNDDEDWIRWDPDKFFRKAKE